MGRGNRGNKEKLPALLAELETVLRANQFDAERPLSAAAFAFQQRLIEEFGGRKEMSEADREAVNARVTQFYNAVEADASAAMAAASALRRLQERFATTTDLDTASRQRWDEMLSHHTTRLRQHVRSLQTRLRPQLRNSRAWMLPCLIWKRIKTEFPSRRFG